MIHRAYSISFFFCVIASTSACGWMGSGDGTSPASTAATPSPAPGASGTPADGNDASAPGTTWQTKFAYRGRFDFGDANGPRFAWPASAIGANFSGSQLTVALAEPAQVYDSGDPVDNIYDVAIDGGVPVLVKATHANTRYTISTQLAPGKHTVWITKRTEANIGLGQFLGLELGDGNLLAPPAKAAHTIEFIGDSASSGYGADGNYPAWNGCSFSVDTADAAVAYPALVGQALHADAVNLSFAGKGITRDLADSDVNTMPKIYDYVEPMSLSVPYDFSGYVPDVVVINIGGNDWVGESGDGTPPDEDTFVSDYMQLLQKVHAHAPNAVIFVTLTAMAYGNDRTSLGRYIQQVQATANPSFGNVYYFEFPEYDGDLGYGCDGHPDIPAHALMAQQLSAAIAAHVHW